VNILRYEKWGVAMNKNRMQEVGKSRVAQVIMADVCNGTVIGIIALWVIWVSTSVLIHFAR